MTVHLGSLFLINVSVCMYKMTKGYEKPIKLCNGLSNSLRHLVTDKCNTGLPDPDSGLG